MIRIAISNEQRYADVESDRWRAVIRMILEDASIRDARISVAVVDSATMRRLHARYLEIDETTDVLSFLLERGRGRLEGEVVVCQPVAKRSARRFGWSAGDELLLYVVHGTLHLVGYDDRKPTQRRRMRSRERHYLARLGLDARYDAPRAKPRRPRARARARGGKSTP